MTSLKNSSAGNPIQVKFLSKALGKNLNRQLPGNNLTWGNCSFSFDSDLSEYDWLVVYDDLPPLQGERFSLRKEILKCPQQNTILVTTEPYSIKTYGSTYASQFGWVLTSQEDWALPHPNRIYSQPALHWYYGLGRDHQISYDSLASMSPNKSKTISTVCSSKKQKNTLHNQRYRFTQKLKEQIPELEIFGHGVRKMDDKALSLDAYRYHIAIENYIGEHHWTEKLSDSFLGFTLPFYCGCTNVEDYFPKESFIYIDIFNVDKSAKIIKDAIQNNEYETRLPFIIEARRRVLEEYNLFAVLAKEINLRHSTNNQSHNQTNSIASRRVIKNKNLKNFLKFFYEKSRNKLRLFISNSFNS